MFGQNPVAKKETTDGMKLRVVTGSPFYTIQGEGPHAGLPAVFLRLHGCPLRCFFCDTQFSDPADPELTVEQILAAITKLDPCRVIKSPVKSGPCDPADWELKPLVVITGGEPTRQNLTPLIQALLRAEYHVQIETAGMFMQRWIEDEHGRVDVIVSPKTPKIDSEVAFWARAFKYVIDAHSVDPEDGLPNASTQEENTKVKVARPPATLTKDVYLSPMDVGDPDKNNRNTMAVAQIAMRFGYRAGLQLHKYMGMP